MIGRRVFIAASAARALAGPLTARAQQAAKKHKLGILGNVPTTDAQGAQADQIIE